MVFLVPLTVDCRFSRHPNEAEHDNQKNIS